MQAVVLDETRQERAIETEGEGGVTPASAFGIGTLAISKVFHSEEQCHTPSESIGNTSHPIDAISNPFWPPLQDGDGEAGGEVWHGMRREREKA